MWMHVDSIDYGAAKLGVAVSDTPAGPFKFLKSFRPNNGQESRDMTIFVDEVGRPSKKNKGKVEGKGDAYVAYSSEMNKVLHISRLTGKRGGKDFFPGCFFFPFPRGSFNLENKKTKTHSFRFFFLVLFSLSLQKKKN